MLNSGRGFSLIEVLAATGILAAVGVTFVSTVFSGYNGLQITDAKIQAEAIIRTQLDDIKISAYQDTGVYPVTAEVPSQYSVSISSQVLNSETCVADGNCNTLQMITVSVSDLEGKSILAISTYKVKE